MQLVVSFRRSLSRRGFLKNWFICVHCSYLVIVFTLALVKLLKNQCFLCAVSQVNGSTKSSTRPSGRIAEIDIHDVGRFLNRALGLPPDIQNR